MTAARMSSADLVHRKGLGFSLWVPMKVRMSASSWRVERWTPRCNCLRVNSANQRSTWLSHEADVGVKWTCQCGRQPGLDRGGLVGGVVVHHDVDVQPLGDVSVNHLEDVEELSGPVATVALTDD